MNPLVAVLVVLTIHRGAVVHESRTAMDLAQCHADRNWLNHMKLMPPYQVRASCEPKHQKDSSK